MLEEIIKIIGLASMSVLFVVSEPMILIKMWLFKGKEGLLWRMINCSKCCAFWIGLIFTRDIYLACIISILAELIYRKLNSGGI